MAWSITEFKGTENTTDAVTNTSSVSWSWTLKTTNGSYDHSGSAWYRVYTEDGSYDSGKLYFKPGASSGSKTKTYTGTTGNFAHNSDGSLASKKFKLDFYETANYNHHYAEYLQGFTTYARYATITSFNVNKRDETSLNVTWGANVACDAVQYRIRQSGGSYGSWIGVNSTNFNITSLTPNTTYVVQIQVRRSDSGLWTTSGEARNTTYDYPYASSLPTFTIENELNVTMYNPLNRTFDYQMLSADDSVIAQGTTQGTNLVFTPNAELLYNTIPNAVSGTYKIKVTYGSNIDQRNTGTYNINTSTNVPTFENFTAQYTADKTNLTNNNQTVINKTSTITFTITANATAKNYSTITKYVVNWGDSTPQEITNISSSVTLTGGSGNKITVVAYDSRGLNSSYDVTISEIVLYNVPINLQVYLHRRNGVEETTYADITGTLYYDTFGSAGVHNLLKAITYTVVGGGENMTFDISTVTYSDQDATNHTQKFTIEDVVINESTTELGFDTDKSYVVQFTVKDTTDTQVLVVGGVASGRFAEDWFKDENGEYHMGINGQADPNYTLTVHGTILGGIRMYMDSNNNLYITDDGSDPNPNAQE